MEYQFLSQAINGEHQPVMLAEAIAALNIKPNGVYLDGTFGRGGHAKLILERLNAAGILIVVDLDLEAIAVANAMQRNDPRLKVFHGSFQYITDICSKFNIQQIDGILLDLGVSSPQLATPSRGFSLMHDGPLDMRMDQTRGVAASVWLRQVSFADLVVVLKKYGEERFAKKIAKAILLAREQRSINTTVELANIIKHSYPKFTKYKHHPATRSFQAIRIFINKELEQLSQSLPELIKRLSIHGRLVVISFHSLEDRIVKQFITQHANNFITNNYAARKIPIDFTNKYCVLKKLGKFKPSVVEVLRNQRSRSAIMRVAEKCM